MPSSARYGCSGSAGGARKTETLYRRGDEGIAPYAQEKVFSHMKRPPGLSVGRSCYGKLLQQLQSAGGAHIHALMAIGTAGDPGGILELGLDDGGEATAHQAQQALAHVLTAGTDALVAQDALALVTLDAHNVGSLRRVLLAG